MAPDQPSIGTIVPRLLLGPGPSPVCPRILSALARPTVGHLDPYFLRLLDDVNQRLRGIFGTQNERTFAVSGTGSAGMEAALVNLLEPGEVAIIAIQGYFGLRLADMARRMGAEVIQVEAAWGEVIPEERLIEAQQAHPEARLIAVVQAETSTGAWQPLRELGQHLRGEETLLVVDAVTALGGIPVEVDAIGIDVCYAGTQKCLGVPPGLAPITFSGRALDRIASRRRPPTSWYLDVSLLTTYLSGDRRYHHTVPINLFYALHEALLEIDEEGLEARFARHLAVGTRLQGELDARGFSSFTDPARRLPQLTAVRLPDDLEEAPLRGRLLEEESIEVGGGLGPAKGRVWRIGLMGAGARDEVVDRLLAAVDRLLPRRAA